MLSILDSLSLLDYCAQIHMYRNMKVVELHQLKKLIDVLLSVHIFQAEVRLEYQEASSKE